MLVVLALVVSVFAIGGTATAAGPTPVGLGNATDAAVLSATQATNTGASAITGDVGTIDPTPTGFVVCPAADCVTYTGGSLHVNDATAIADKFDADAARVHTAALAGAIAIPAQLGGQTYAAGLYSTGAADIANGTTLTLDAANDPDSVWIFQAASSIQANTLSNVVFINTAGTSPAQLACNVFWTSVSSANLLGPQFVGTVLANASITVGAGVTVNGRLFAGTGNVTLITDTIIRPTCTTVPAGTGGTPSTPTTTAPGITPVVATPGRLTG